MESVEYGHDDDDNIDSNDKEGIEESNHIIGSSLAARRRRKMCLYWGTVMGLLVILSAVGIGLIASFTHNSNKVQPSHLKKGSATTTGTVVVDDDSGKKEKIPGREQDLTAADSHGDSDKVVVPDTTTTTAPSPTTASTTISDDICAALDCQTDRMGHFQHLIAGQTLCNAQYRFGLTPDAELVWMDCDNQVKRLLYRPNEDDSSSMTSSSISYFQMTDEAIFQLYDSQDNLIWEIKSDYDIQFRAKCLRNPALDCPYLHLHKSGDLVLNYIDHTTRRWIDMNTKKKFKGLFPPDDDNNNSR